MKAKILTFLVFFALFFGIGAYFLSTTVVYHGHSLGSVVETTSFGSWPFKVSGGLYQESYGAHQRGFIVKNEELAQRLAKSEGRELVFEIRSTFMNLSAPYNEQIVSFREAPEPAVELLEDDRLCRLVAVITQSKAMVDALRPRIERDDPELLDQLKTCQRSE
jgi:hypothetical protein